MASSNEDHFRVKPAAPKSRGGPRPQRFVSQVLKQVSKSGAKPSGKSFGRPANTFGRGRVAASMAGQRLGPNARRVIIKSRFVVLRRASPNSVAIHLRYIERDGVTRDGQKGQAYSAGTDAADLKAFQERGQNDRHQFRFIVSAEDGLELEDLKGFTRQLMRRMEIDLETRLDWVAVDHWDTDNPHTHIVLNGRTGGPASGREDLVIAPDYMAHGMRLRASEIATEWLGPVTEAEIQRSMQREVDHERWTRLDRTLQRESVDGLVRPETLAEPRLRQQRQMLIGRLQRLQRMGLSTRQQSGTWSVHTEAEPILRAMGDRGDIIRIVQRAMSGRLRELAVFQPGDDGHLIVGRVVDKGMADELYDKGYLVVDGIDGKAHYVALPARSELEQYPTGAVVKVKGSADARAVDRNIAALASDGLYHTDHHLAIAQGQPQTRRYAHEVVAFHVRRLEALRRSGVVTRVAEGLWQVPNDLPERGRQHDARNWDGVAVELKSHLSIERQVRAIGASWLDHQLIGGSSELSAFGFGKEVKDALQQRVDFLANQGLAERRGQRVILPRNLLAKLRNRELTHVAKALANETGRKHRPVADDERVTGTYRRSVLLTSGRYAILDDGLTFSLVPWKPVIEQRLGQQIAVTVRGGAVSWELGQQRQWGMSP